MVFCCLLIVCGRLLVVCDRLCSFVVVCSGLWSLPVLVTMEKNTFLIKCLFNKVLPYFLYCKDMVKPYYIKGVHRVKCSQMFYKIVVLESFAKFAGKHLFSYNFCQIFKNTNFLITL